MAFKAHIYIKPDAQFHFIEARSVSFAFKPKIKAILLRLQGISVIEPVQKAEFKATQIVLFPKLNETIRIFSDFKVTVYKYADMQRFYLPHPEELLAAVAGGNLFSKMDLANAYLQMEVDENSRKYLVFSTHRGLFCYTCLLF